VSQDPYVAAGLVTGHRIWPWQIDTGDAQYFKEGQTQNCPEEKNIESEFESSGEEGEQALPWRSEGQSVAAEVPYFGEGQKQASPPRRGEKRADPSLLARISSMSGFSRVDGAHKNKLWSWEVGDGLRTDTKEKLNGFPLGWTCCSSLAREKLIRHSLQDVLRGGSGGDSGNCLLNAREDCGSTGPVLDQFSGRSLIHLVECNGQSQEIAPQEHQQLDLSEASGVKHAWRTELA
jgi:hypothetical protein